MVGPGCPPCLRQALRRAPRPGPVSPHHRPGTRPPFARRFGRDGPPARPVPRGDRRWQGPTAPEAKGSTRWRARAPAPSPRWRRAARRGGRPGRRAGAARRPAARSSQGGSGGGGLPGAVRRGLWRAGARQPPLPSPQGKRRRRSAARSGAAPGGRAR